MQTGAFRLVVLAAAVWLTACAQSPGARHADVIVVGAGIAGLSAALEASTNGARVLIVDANSVGGGHAVKAGGFAIVDSALQREKGISDSPGRAYADWLKRGEDPDPFWAFRYAEHSATDVYDWLTGQGVEFKLVLPTSEDSVPRFHFTAGTAVNAVVPLLRKVLYDTNIEFIWNTRVTALARSNGRINGVMTRNERTGDKQLYRANTVVLATGGLQNNLAEVVANWRPDETPPARILKGAGHFATGDGYRLAAWAGADMQDMQKQVTFYNGLPDPRDASGQRGLAAQNPAAIYVNADGHRFMNERDDAKQLELALRGMEDAAYWLVFDSAGARRFSLRDAPWITRDTVRNEVLDNPRVVHKAGSVKKLARMAGLPEYGLKTTVEIWNRMIDVEEDFQFGRFDRRNPDRFADAIAEPPYYAVRLYPMTRKSMGGPAINAKAQVLDSSGQAIPGLYAAGELTGVGGVNGSYGGAGTFLGPSVYMGRIAGRAAATEALPAGFYKRIDIAPASGGPAPGAPGYWHFDKTHSLVTERGYQCTMCHSDTNPMQPADRRAVLLARLDTCVYCH